MSTNVSASTSASGSSASNQTQGLSSPTPTEAGEGRLSTPSKGSLLLTPSSKDLAVWFHPETKDVMVVGEKEEDEENDPSQSLHQSALKIPDDL
uniref:Uncharacterized protein n=1 Tax=Moniliophthora roreri TaxID=221103 RepID=A0A0W0FU43_MONRR